ncbi:VOC family protein [uncultured Friedmanniella sp.]|uniref:VOC family protein n=1 Tax=uncultured Friedmanniella sp. TaxID=335381 RepID=UPI0035CA9DD2
MGELRLSVTYLNLGTPDVDRLVQFYADLLGWTVETADAGWATLANPDGGPGLAFQPEQHHVRPVWPAQPGHPQMTAHLEIRASDLAAGSRHAVACGAIVADFQPQDDVLVHLDPDGHPFCLYVE